jgi:D-alanine-D-alanine ligase
MDMDAGKVVILYGEVSPQAGKDEQDVIDQVRLVKKALMALGFKVFELAINLNLKTAVKSLKKIKPQFVFNLVESIQGRGEYIYFAPALLDSMHIPFTGAGNNAMILTSNKITAKKLFQTFNIPTPLWGSAKQALSGEITFSPPYIIKRVWEHASLGLDERSLAFSQSELVDRIKEKACEKTIGDFFIESYIEGREFNLSLLAEAKVAQVLPCAEIRFIDYEPGKAKIVDYKAKWEEGSFEFRNTPRTFEFGAADAPLLATLKSLALCCWESFNLSGYARVDFRIDEKGNPYVLEINANPCIAPDSGFMAACQQAGLTPEQVVKRIIAGIGNI